MQPFNLLSRYCFALACAFAICISSQAAHAQDKDETEKPKKEDTASLTIGSKAPELDIEHWLSDNEGAFEHVTKFEKDKIYVIDFFRARSEASIRTMPNIAKAQAKYEDKDVQIISVSNEPLEQLQQFLEFPVPPMKAGEVADPTKTFSDLTNNYCLTTDPDNSVQKDYLVAARESRIPLAFIVGKSGLIEWIGNPEKMDESLDAILEDKWDREEFKVTFEKEKKKRMAAAESEQKTARKIALGMRKVQEKTQAGEIDEALELMADLINDKELESAKEGLAFIRVQLMISMDHSDAATTMKEFIDDNKDDTTILNTLAWGLYELYEKKNGELNPELLKEAKRASEFTIEAEPKNGAYLDTLAHFVYIVDEDLDKAIELQKRAVKYSPSQVGVNVDEIKLFLKQLLKEKETGKKKKKQKKQIESDF